MRRAPHGETQWCLPISQNNPRKKLADRSLSPSLLARTRRLSRCRGEAGVQHNRREAHHRQDERPTPGRGPGAERRRAAHAAASSAPNRRRGQGPGDPNATSPRRLGGGSITRPARHPPARSQPTRPRALQRKAKQRTVSAGAAECPPSSRGHADRTHSAPELPAAPGVHGPMASAPCDRAKPGRKSATCFSEPGPRSAGLRLRACPGAPRVCTQGCPPRSRDASCGRPITLAPPTFARVFLTEYPSGAKIMPPDCILQQLCPTSQVDPSHPA